MSTKKTIQINPELFSVNKTRKKKEKVIQNKPLIKANSLKKALLKRIKHHARNRERRQENNEKNDNNKDEEFSNDFHSHLDYLNNVQKKNKTMRRQRTESQESNVQANIFLPPELSDVSNDLKIQIPSTPPYGCLKNGNKPTWRQWKNTTQKIVEPIPVQNNFETSSGFDFDTSDLVTPSFNTRFSKTNELTERELKLQSLRKKLQEEEVEEKKKKDKKKKSVATLKKRTTKFENHYGKQNNKVSVLVKNSTTRKNIQKEHNLLKQDSINEVKKYLKNHYLLKVGSNAPNDVLRKMYETIHLCGDVKNVNSNNLVHNYLNDEIGEDM